MKVRVDKDTCVGHGRCYELAPEVFEEDERGHCQIKREEVPKKLQEQARYGVGNCPEKALSIEE